MRKIEGIVYKHGKDDYEYCDGFNLSTQEEGRYRAYRIKPQTGRIFCQRQKRGYLKRNRRRITGKAIGYAKNIM